MGHRRVKSGSGHRPSARRGGIERAVRLTAERQQLVDESFEWLAKWTCLCAPRAAIDALGWSEVLSLAQLLVVKSASLWRPDSGAKFRTFAMNAVKRFLPVALWRAGRNSNVWREMAVFEDDRGRELPISTQMPDRRRTDGPDPLLAFWHDPDYRAQRACLSWRQRIVLYLRLVECWTLQEVAVVFGLSRERIRQSEVKAARLLAEDRMVRAAARARSEPHQEVNDTHRRAG